MTTLLATESERLAALAALAIGQEPTSSPAPVRIVDTGREVYAGGDVRRRLIGDASLTYREQPGGRLLHADAVPGDVILVTEEQALRLDGLLVTVDPDADPVEVAEAQASTAAADEVLRAMSAAELVAYVTQNPDERARVRELEQARPVTGRKGSGPRATVLRATEPTPLEDDEVAGRILAHDAARHDLEDVLVAGTVDDVDPVRGQPAPTETLLDPLATIGTPDRPAPLNLP